MITVTKKSAAKKEDIKKLRMKARLFDELLDLIEDHYFGELMRRTEKEPNIPLKKARRLLK